MTANSPLLNAPLLAVLLGVIELLRLQVLDLEDQVAAARATVDQQQDDFANYRLTRGDR